MSPDGKVVAAVLVGIVISMEMMRMIEKVMVIVVVMLLVMVMTVDGSDGDFGKNAGDNR